MANRPRNLNATVRTSSVVNLKYPFTEADVRKLTIGAEVSISGTVYTGRDRLHKYLFEDGESPVDLKDAAIFHCGPIVVKDDEGQWKVVAAGPTTSSRENPYMPQIITDRGVRVILGKGGMSAETQNACREYGAVYIQVVGGAAAWLAKCVKRVDAVWFLNEFGATEAMWKLEVENLTGIVAINANGESLFSGVEKFSQRRLRALIGSPLVLDLKRAGKPGMEYQQPRDSAGDLPPLNIVFMGSADVSCTVLKQLVETPEYKVKAVITQPDKPSGRNRKLTPCPAKAFALEKGLEVLDPPKLNVDEVREKIKAYNPDVIIVVAYGQFLGSKILAMPRLGCLNVHLSLLPKYRGAAPIHRCVENGDSVSGVTIMRMDQGMDSGDILMQCTTDILPDETAGSLHDRLSGLGANLLIKCLPKWRSGLIKPIRQDIKEVTFANKLCKADGFLDWNLPAELLARRVRAFNPWPACYSIFTPPGSDKVERLKVLSARCEELPKDVAFEPGIVADISSEGIAIATKDGMLRLLEVRREGSKTFNGLQFAQSCPFKVGDRFSFDMPKPSNDDE